MNSPRAQVPEEPVLWLVDDPTPLARILLLGALTSIRLSGEIGADAARELLAVGRRTVLRRGSPRV